MSIVLASAILRLSQVRRGKEEVKERDVCVCVCLKQGYTTTAY